MSRIHASGDLQTMLMRNKYEKNESPSWSSTCKSSTSYRLRRSWYLVKTLRSNRTQLIKYLVHALQHNVLPMRVISLHHRIGCQSSRWWGLRQSLIVVGLSVQGTHHRLHLFLGLDCLTAQTVLCGYRKSRLHFLLSTPVDEKPVQPTNLALMMP